MRKRLATIIVSTLSTLMFTACAPGIFVAGAAAGGAVIYDHRDFATQMDDHNIVYQIKQRFADNDQLIKDSHISVSSFNHVVLLVGETPTPALRRKANRIANNTPKVRRVFNRITVAPHPSIKQAANDSWLTTKIKTAMLAEKGLHSTQIKVVTEKRTAYLMGLVSRKQADIATNVTRHVAGVNRVVKLFEYTH